MTAEAAVPADAPVMIAWTAYKAREEYANSWRWAAHEEHRDGSMWAAFYAGFYAAAFNAAQAAEPPASPVGAVEAGRLGKLRRVYERWANEDAESIEVLAAVAAFLRSTPSPTREEVARARVISLLEAMRDGDPDDGAADAVTCWMVWKDEAIKLLSLFGRAG